MKIFLLALVGLAAGGAVKTISTSSISDSTGAAPPDSSAPLAASSDSSAPDFTNPTSFPSSMGSIESTNSSTSSPTAPAGDDIREIAVSMTFDVEAIDDGSDKEMFSNIKKSVAESLDGALGTDVTMNKIAVVETAPAGRRLGEDKSIQVDYTFEVKESYVAAANESIGKNYFHTEFGKSLEGNGTTLTPGKSVKSVILCDEILKPKVAEGTLTCSDPGDNSSRKNCVLACGSNYRPKPSVTVSLTCNNDGAWVGQKGECEARLCKRANIEHPSVGTLDCTGRLQSGSAACTLKCAPNGVPKTASTYQCNVSTTHADGAEWSLASTAGACDPITCAASTESPPADGALACADTKAGGNPCVLTCPTNGIKTYKVEEKSGLRCYGDGSSTAAEGGKWLGYKGKCVETCKEADDVCMKNDLSYGTCGDANNKICVTCRAVGDVCTNSGNFGKCTSVGVCTGDASVCRASGGIAAGKACTVTGKGKTVMGTCKSALCDSSEQNVKIVMRIKVPMAEADINKIIVQGEPENILFIADFKKSVAASLVGVAVADAETFVKVEPLTKVDHGRRLNGKFLQDTPTRMLQIEYSVQVNQSDAANAKAALDDQSTFMYSSNLT